MGAVNGQHLTVLVVAVAAACAALGWWLGTTVADDAGSIILITVGCAVLGSFAPTAARWLTGGAGRRTRPPR
jgi:hypothetical protein